MTVRVSPSFESPTASSAPAAGAEPLQPPVQKEPYRALPRSEEKRTEAHAYCCSKNVGKFVGFPVTLLTHENLDARAKERGLRAGPRSKVPLWLPRHVAPAEEAPGTQWLGRAASGSRAGKGAGRAGAISLGLQFAEIPGSPITRMLTRAFS